MLYSKAILKNRASRYCPHSRTNSTSKNKTHHEYDKVKTGLVHLQVFLGRLHELLAVLPQGGLGKGPQVVIEREARCGKDTRSHLVPVAPAAPSHRAQSVRDHTSQQASSRTTGDHGTRRPNMCVALSRDHTPPQGCEKDARRLETECPRRADIYPTKSTSTRGRSVSSNKKPSKLNTPEGYYCGPRVSTGYHCGATPNAAPLRLPVGTRRNM